jgi:hypothetical protein
MVFTPAKWHACPCCCALPSPAAHLQKLQNALAQLKQNYKRVLEEVQQEVSGKVMAVEQRRAAKKHKAGHKTQALTGFEG